MSTEKKSQQLGMPIGTATARLRKNILFSFLEKTKENICFQCGEIIENVDDLSIEHKEPWLDSDNPLDKFFSLDNIAFSHLTCNIGAARKDVGPRVGHGTSGMYARGCRCKLCVDCNTNKCRDWNLRTGRTSHTAS